MDRRQFIKITAATGAGTSVASCSSGPADQLIRFISEEEKEMVPGIASWRPSICPLCASGCGVLVRIMEGDAEVVRNGQLGTMKLGLAKKLEGNPEHPISQGKLCPRGQAAIQVTYHPDRIRTPLKRSGERGSGEYQEISWDDALAELVSKLDELAAANDQKSAAFLTRPVRGQRQALISQFLSLYGAPGVVEYETFGDQVLRRANARSFGYEQLPTFDLGRSRYVISFGADFLGTWNSPVAQNVAYGQMRQGHPAERGKFVQVELRMSQTGANADEWVPARPGTEGVLALGIAHVIMRDGLRPASGAGRAGNQIEGWAGGLSTYTPQEVEARTGVTVARIERLAREFAGNSPALALIGGAPLAHTNGLFSALAVNALNAIVGSVEQPGGVFFSPRPNLAGTLPSLQGPSIDKVAADLLATDRSPIQVLMLHDANPVFGTPPAWRVKEALLKIPYIVSFGHFVDETSALADLILPDHSFLESWVDQTPESGSTMMVASVAPPAMRPLYPTRSMPDVLLDVSRKLGRPLSPALPWETYQNMLQDAFSAMPAPQASTTPDQPATDVWTTVQQRGGWWNQGPARTDATNVVPADVAVAYSEAQFDGAAGDYPFYFLPYPSQAFLDGSLAHLPWLQELPDVLSTAMWSSWIEVNAQRAAELGINQGDLLEVASSHGTLRAPALLSPGIAPDVVAMPVGQGHDTFTRYASGRGANPLSILAPTVEPQTGALAWASTRVKISRVEGDGKLILFAGGMREHGEHPR